MIEEDGTVTFFCRQCGGRGIIQTAYTPHETFACPACRGSGKQEPCPTCNGRGSFPHRQAIMG